jgi:hypothetical protein
VRAACGYGSAVSLQVLIQRVGATAYAVRSLVDARRRAWREGTDFGDALGRMADDLEQEMTDEERAAYRAAQSRDGIT